MEKSSTLPKNLGVVDIGKVAFLLPSTAVADFTYIYRSIGSSG